MYQWKSSSFNCNATNINPNTEWKINPLTNPSFFCILKYFIKKINKAKLIKNI